MAEAIHKELDKHYRQRVEWSKKHNHRMDEKPPVPPDDGHIDALKVSLCAPQPWTVPNRVSLLPTDYQVDMAKHIAELCRATHWELIPLARLMCHTEFRNDARISDSWWFERGVASARRCQGADWDLRDVAEAVVWCGGKPGDLAESMFERWANRYNDWGADATWPYLSEHVDVLVGVLESAARGTTTGGATASNTPSACSRRSRSSRAPCW